MSLNGNLEQFQLVDVIQFLHMTGKTGFLTLRGVKGVSQLVFADGYFVSANHLNSSMRIGKVLVDMNAITEETLDRTLEEQKIAGTDRKPLIVMLIEDGRIDRDTAYKGLEALIKMTIVEVMTWESGTFSFETSDECILDEYRYFPQKLHMKILLNAQGVLLESLRIYDEMMRDGTLAQMFCSKDGDSDGTAPFFDAETKEKTVRCLDALDTISRKVQDLFTGLKACTSSDDKTPDASVNHQDELVMYLTECTEQAQENQQDYSLLPSHCEIPDDSIS